MPSSEVIMEFVGGPYDGFSQILDEFESDLAPEFELPVQQNLIRIMSGQALGSQQHVRTVAVYALTSESGTIRYVFSRVRWATGAERPIFDHWCEQILESWQRAGR